MRVNPYLIFPGTCQQAFEFYQACLGGTIEVMQNYYRSPLDVPEEHDQRIYNAVLRTGDLLLRGADDMPPDHLTTQGTNIALFLICDDDTQQQSVFEKLSAGGSIDMPIEDKFGMLTDKFGIQWMLACP